MAIHIYEPIKGNDNDERGMMDPMKTIENDENENDFQKVIHVDDDVESGLGTSHRRSSSIVTKNIEEDGSSFVPISHRHTHPIMQNQQRLKSLDVFRGLTVGLMILADDVGGIVPAINHAPWNGLTLADYVMPFFLFIVGVALSLTYKKLSCKIVASRKAVLRSLKLLVLGLFLQGGFFHGIRDLTYGVDLEKMRVMGILQRIAIAYLVAALCEIWLKADNEVNSGLSLLRKYRYQWLVALLLTILYLSLLYGLYVPDWEYEVPAGSSSSAPKKFVVKCGIRGDTGPACNAVGMIDRKIIGIRHLYRRPIYSRTEQCSINSPDYGPLPSDAPSWCQAPFDPEGFLSSVMAIVTCFIGLHFGHIIIHLKDHSHRALHWMVMSCSLTILGIALDFFGLRANKALYSLSYTCITAGVAGVLFTAIYLMVDVFGCSCMAIVFEWIGKNALTIYVLVACNILPLILLGFYWGQPQNNILKLVGIGR